MMMKLEQYNDDDHDDNDDDEAMLTLQRITAAGMTENAELALRVQVAALITAWQREKDERDDLADGMFTDGNKSYQQGYADALDQCVQALKPLAGT